MEVEYRIPADAQYFTVLSRMIVEKPIRVVLVRNNEMTMNLFFTHVAWPGRDGRPRVVTFEERRLALERNPIPADTPWFAFLNLDKGYGYGFVTLEYRATKSVNPGISISDGTLSRAELAEEQAKAAAAGKTDSGRVINGRYWSRHIISGQEVDLAPGDEFLERTAYVLFRCSTEKPVSELLDLEKRIRR